MSVCDESVAVRYHVWLEVLLFQQVGREYLELDIGCYDVCICHVMIGRLYDDYVDQIACDAVRHGTVLTSRFYLTINHKNSTSVLTHREQNLFFFFYLTTLEYVHRNDQARNTSTERKTWTSLSHYPYVILVKPLNSLSLNLVLGKRH